jgi:CRISPR/Cas system CSM-associated protein Csm3 (group 7 of RAMP superfamily)
MLLQGKLTAESPIYRGNGRKTLFTRDGDGTQRLVSLAGEITGTAQSLMDAFIGQSRDGKNTGLLNQLWLRLYGTRLPTELITRVECKLRDDSYPRDHFFDLRMGIKLDEDRWAADANANYKMETLFRHAVFDFSLAVDDAALQQSDNAARLYTLLDELRAGRFWFGAGKSKGLGRVKLDMELPVGATLVVAPLGVAPQPSGSRANHLRLGLTFSAINPVLVGWNWGKVDPDVPSFAAIEGQLLIGSMQDLPDPIRSRLELSIGGPILSPADWKNKFAALLPRVIAIWLRDQSMGEVDSWLLPSAFLPKLSKGKYPFSKDTLESVRPVCDQPFPSQAAVEAALTAAMGKKANMAKRVLEGLEHKREARRQLNPATWREVATGLDLDAGTAAGSAAILAAHIQDEAALTAALADICQPILPRFYDQVDQQIKLLQSDAWVDAELANRQGHLLIKVMLLEGRINEAQWNNRNEPPAGVNAAIWRTFLEEHSRVRFQHMLAPVNLRKSITNDRNFIAFLKSYREKTRLELAQPHHIDFRAGGPFNRDVSQKYGKPYDTVFMRMLTWSPSAQQAGAWETYVPGSTIKGAFRKRVAQVLKTLWGESPRTTEMLDRLFGAQRRRGLVYFSDAYLSDPNDQGQAWCAMDGVKMNPATGQPVEMAKTDCLFAYGDQLVFSLQIDVQDIEDRDLEALSLLSHALEDFRRGDIPLGGEKTSGLGWVKASITQLDWRTTDPKGVSAKLFGQQTLTQAGVWHQLTLEGDAAAQALRQALQPVTSAKPLTAAAPPKAALGFTSHRSFSGYCGTLAVEAEILTPTNVRESGQPSCTTTLADGPVNGWDFFALASPKAELREAHKTYALPSRSLKGMLRHLYSIVSDSKETGSDIGHLNPVDKLFGWVGTGQNQALMGRLAFGFGQFEPSTELAWFKVPYPYGKWKYTGGEWQSTSDTRAAKLQINKTWRLFPHAPLGPMVTRLTDFVPDTVQASYFRAILPGARARFTIRFWNLDEQELQRLMWCIVLEPGLAHKIGNNRYLGFGSLRLSALPDSFLIDWATRYTGLPASLPESPGAPASLPAGEAWRMPLKVQDWLKPREAGLANYTDLVKALDAKRL